VAWWCGVGLFEGAMVEEIAKGVAGEVASPITSAERRGGGAMEDGGAERGTRNEETLVQVNQCFLVRACRRHVLYLVGCRDLGETPDPDCLHRHWS
jgi:hypothetical protein